MRSEWESNLGHQTGKSTVKWAGMVIILLRNVMLILVSLEMAHFKERLLSTGV